MTRPAPKPLPRRCQVCREAPASGLFIGWPGLSAQQPAAIRDKRVAVCASHACALRAVARAIIAAAAPWPWHQSGHSQADRATIEAMVAELRGTGPRTPHPSPPPIPAPTQPTLF